MEVNVRRSRGVAILELEGKFTLGGGGIAFLNALFDVLFAGETKVVVNMRGVTTIDSTGISELVSGFTTTANEGARFALAELPPMVASILEITQLLSIIGVYDDEDEAVRSLA